MSIPRAVARRVGIIALAVAAVLSFAVVPAQAAPSCWVTYRKSANHSVYTVNGNPQNAGKVYSFRVNWGLTNRVSTYIPTYRTYYGPKKGLVNTVEGWVNGYKCRTWSARGIF